MTQQSVPAAAQQQPQPTTAIAKLRALVGRHQVITFILIAFPIQAFIVWTQVKEIRNYGLSAARIFIPALTALFVAWVGEGPKSALKLLKSLFAWKRHPKFYLFAIFYPSFIAFLALGLLYAIKMIPDFHVDWEAGAGWGFFFLVCRIASSEEVTWVGFMTSRLARRYNLMQASAIVGALWGVWYIPLVLAEIQVTPGLPIGPLIFNFATIAAICAWLYYRTHSAAVVFMMQMATNYTSQIIPVLPQRGGMNAYIAFAGIKGVFAIVLFVFWGPKPLFGRVKPGTSSLDTPDKKYDEDEDDAAKALAT
jgi:membrane protease YdiL (CAAX protease family)